MGESKKLLPTKQNKSTRSKRDIATSTTPYGIGVNLRKGLLPRRARTAALAGLRKFYSEHSNDSCVGRRTRKTTKAASKSKTKASIKLQEKSEDEQSAASDQVKKTSRNITPTNKATRAVKHSLRSGC